MNYAAKIIGTGCAFPERRMTNDDIVNRLEEEDVSTNDRWILERTGIRERRFSDLNNPDERNSSLGVAAGRKALKMAGRSPEDMDQIILCHLFAGYVTSFHGLLVSA